MSEPALLDTIIAEVAGQLPPLDPSQEAGTSRDLFLELTTVSLGNLYLKMPLPGTLYDRAMLKAATEGVADDELAKITRFGEDWLRLEGVIRAAEGQKAYSLNRPAVAVLSTQTAIGTLGNVMERITKAYADGLATPHLRRHARRLATYFLTRIARS
jgi:hypothetical protein